MDSFSLIAAASRIAAARFGEQNPVEDKPANVTGGLCEPAKVSRYILFCLGHWFCHTLLGAAGHRRSGVGARLYKYIGKRMRAQRQALGMSQERLGEAIGVSFSTNSEVQNGRSRVSAARLFDLCRALKTPLSSMFERDPTA
jgi:DNA-binding XRE family transcriptional regulator